MAQHNQIITIAQHNQINNYTVMDRDMRQRLQLARYRRRKAIRSLNPDVKLPLELASYDN
jgi:hypothetical protein